MGRGVEWGVGREFIVGEDGERKRENGWLEDRSLRGRDEMKMRTRMRECLRIDRLID